MNIYKVEANFDDSESSYSLTIGLFDCEKRAEIIKDKWLSFFKQQKELFFKPKNWNPKLDKWFYNGDFDWVDSFEYYNLKSKYRPIMNFTTIDIHKKSINKESIIDSFKHYQNITDKMKEFDRDWKLKQIINQ